MPPVPHGRNTPASQPPTRFIVIKQLAVTQGQNNGGIFKVLDRQTGKKCIEKRFKPQDVHEGAAYNEIRIHLKLKHNNVVGYLDAFLQKGPQYRSSLYLELGTLGSLEDHLNKYYYDGMGFPESRVWNVFKALTNALGYIHYGIQNTILGGPPKAGWQMLLHRDVAPKNIFVNMLPDGKIRTMLGDFGCAIEYQNQGVFNVKTPFWGPPEKPQYGPWSDIWSLGGVIRSMVQLQGPAHRYGPLAFVENGYPENQFSSELLNCLRCTLQTDYRRRPTANVLGPALNERSHQAKYAEVNYPDWYGDDPLSLW